jgi:hypothetical protein
MRPPSNAKVLDPEPRLRLDQHNQPVIAPPDRHINDPRSAQMRKHLRPDIPMIPIIFRKYGRIVAQIECKAITHD